MLRFVLTVLLVCIIYASLLSRTASIEASSDESTRSKLYVVPVPSFPAFTNLTVLNFQDLPRKAYLVTTSEPWKVVVPSPYPRLQRTSVQAKKHDCRLATNGGPFQADGTCVGAVIVNGRVVADDFGGATGFGITRRGPDETKWVVGTIDSVQQAQELKLQHFVTGFDWLVENGKNIANLYNNTTGGDKAPRTAIGIDFQGRLLLMVADGCEHCFRRKGLTLSHFADVLVRVGARFAVNLDGGSSSVLVYNGKVRNTPTCLDYIDIKCERPVASVMCIHSTKGQIKQSSDVI